MTEKRIYSLYDLAIEVLYPMKPTIQMDNWDTWLEDCTDEVRNRIQVLRSSYAEIEALGIRVCEVIEPLGTDNTWIDQYPHDYVRQKYPERTSVPHIIVAFQLDGDLHLHTGRDIECRMYAFSETEKKLFAEFLFVTFPRQYVYDRITSVWFLLPREDEEEGEKTES